MLTNYVGLMFLLTQVAPAELEAILLEHPLIADVAVIGVPDERAGERPKAFVVRREGAVVSSDDVISYVAENAAEYKVPAEVGPIRFLFC